jgi:iron-sulfur cluster assembly protein
LKLTPAAVSQLQALLSAPDPKLIRVGVRNRGCSGLAYNLEYVEKPGAFDEAVEQDGVRVLIDSKALFSIIGSEMDWVEDRLSARFVFRNPNISEYFSGIHASSPFSWVSRCVLTALRRGAMWVWGVVHGLTTTTG